MSLTSLEFNPDKFHKGISGTDWYVLYVRPRMEKRVSERLSEAGFVNYVPIKRTLRILRDRRKWVEATAVSGYVFIRMDREDRLQVLQTNHVTGIVREFGQDALIPSSQIRIMQQMLGQEEYPVEFNDTHLAPGEPVVVIEGAMTGFKGEMVRIQGKNKVLLRLQQIHTNMIIELPSEMVARAEDYQMLASDIEKLKEVYEEISDTIL